MSIPTLTRPSGTPVLDVVIPVYNEERDLGPCVRRLHAYLEAHLPYPFRITIADNASVDDTPVVARQLAGEFAHVVHLRLDAKGRGRALRAAWTGSDAPVLAYMDVDLSTDLAALLPLVAPLISGHSDLAIGSRLARGSRVVRGPKRELISRGYNLLLRRTLAASFSDAQCGFKAIRSDVAARLLPLVRFGLQPGIAWSIHKHVLVRRGIIGSAVVRPPASDADPGTLAALGDILADLGL
ncbi:hypothetical protein GCM10009558_107000 [Virgisporangium aurantiacum]